MIIPGEEQLAVIPTEDLALMIGGFYITVAVRNLSVPDNGHTQGSPSFIFNPGSLNLICNCGHLVSSMW